MPDQSEIIQKLSVPRYAPRLEALPVPEPLWNAAPLLCLQVNDEWVSHILGVLIALDQPDAWIGNEDEIYAARQQVNEIMLAFMEVCDDMSGCCPDPLIRVNADGTIEKSDDGGVTWIPVGNTDPRTTIPQFPPLGGDDGDEKKCSSANNVLGQFKDGIAKFEGYFDTTATVVEFVAACAGAIAALIFAPFTVPFIVAAIIALMSAVYNVGKAAYVASFNDGVYGELLCILYCNCQDDGTYSDENFSAIRDAIASNFSSIASDAFTVLLNGVTLTGLNNMAKTPTGSDTSCDSCHCDDTWCYFFDFTVDSYSEFWSGITTTENPAVFNTSYVDGVGWVTGNASPNYSGIKISEDYLGNLTQVTFAENGTDVDFMALLNAGQDVIVNYGISDRNFDGTEPSYEFLGIGLRSATVIINCTLQGTGINPFGFNNC